MSSGSKSELIKKINYFSEPTKILKNTESVGIRVFAELLANVILGIMLGYMFDKIFETSPMFLFIFIVFGKIVSFYNIYNSFNNK